MSQSTETRSRVSFRRRNSEEIGLQSLPHFQGNSESSNVNTKSLKSLGSNDEKIYRHADDQWQLALHTTGVYGVIPKKSNGLPQGFDQGRPYRVHNRLYDFLGTSMNWTPFAYGGCWSLMILILLVLVIVLHTLLVVSVWNHGMSKLSHIAPPVIGTVFARILIHHSIQVIRALDAAVDAPSKLVNLVRGRVKRLNTMVVFVLIPFLSMPVTKTFTVIKERHRGINVARNFDLNNIGPFISSTIPAISYPVEQIGVTDLVDGAIMGNSRWSFIQSYKSFSGDLEYAVRFVGPHAAPNVSLSGIADGMHSTFIPIIYKTQAPLVEGAVILDHEGGKGSNFEMLHGALECERVLIKTQNPSLGFEGGQRYVRIDAQDSLGCIANFTMSAIDVDKDYLHLILNSSDKFETWLTETINPSNSDYGELTRLRDYRRRLIEYFAEVEAAAELVMFSPIWSVGQHQGSTDHGQACPSRFFFASFSNPFIPIYNGSISSNLELASCVGKYYTSKGNVHLRTSLLQDKFRDPASELKFLDQNFKTPESLHIDFSVYPGPWPMLIESNSRLQTRLDDVMRGTIDSQGVFGPIYPLRLLQYQYFSLQHREVDSNGAVIYGAQRLLALVMDKVSAAATTLSNVKDTSSWQDLRMNVLRCKPQIFQISDWLVLVYIVWVFLSMVCLLEFLLRNNWSRISCIPWHISSIAARAMLLYRSRMVNSLAKSHLGPEKVEELRPVLIGYWSMADDNAVKSWHADSLLLNNKLEDLKQDPNIEEEDYESVFMIVLQGFCGIFVDILECFACHSPLRRLRSNFLSLRGVAFARTQIKSLLRVLHYYAPFLATCTAVVSITVSLHLATSARVSESFTVNIIHIFMGENAQSSKTFWYELFLRLLPGIMIFYIIYSLEHLLHYYKQHQPWSALLQASPVRRKHILTLDYVQPLLPIYSALRNRHWYLASLILGSILMLPAPTFLFNIFHVQSVPRIESTQIRSASYSWEHDGCLVKDLDMEGRIGRVFNKAFASVTDTQSIPRWSSYERALLPIDQNAPSWDQENLDLFSDQANYWQLETKTIRAALDCEDLPHNEIVFQGPYDLPIAAEDRKIRVFSKNRDMRFDGQPFLDLNICPGRPMNSANDGKQTSICSTWRLVNQTLSPSVLSPPHSQDAVWILTATEYNDKQQNSKVLLCQPKVYFGSVEAYLLSPFDNLDGATIQNTRLLDEQFLENKMAINYSQIINNVMLTPRKVKEGEALSSMRGHVDSTLVAVPHFTGDILSFLSHSWATSRHRGLTTGQSLAKSANAVFALTFAIAVQDLGFLNKDTPERTVEVQRLSLQEQLYVSKWRAIYLIVLTVYVFLIFGLHEIRLWWYKDRQYPFPPEASLENSWYYLYQSTLVKRIGEAVPEPEKLKLAEFYAAVDALQLDCAFNYPKPTPGAEEHWLPRVDVSSELETTPYKSVRISRPRDGRTILESSRDSQERERLLAETEEEPDSDDANGARE